MKSRSIQRATHTTTKQLAGAFTRGNWNFDPLRVSVGEGWEE